MIKCAICGINPATTKNCVEINGVIHSMPSCAPCISLDGRSVAALLGADRGKRLRLIKSWWNPKKRKTTLPGVYPGVDWAKVRCR